VAYRWEKKFDEENRGKPYYVRNVQ
jgi:hypothetical protein